MNARVLPIPEYHWECPSCARQHVTREPRPHTPMHQCPRHAGLDMPFARVQGRAAGLVRGQVVHRVIERGDFLNGDRGQPMVGGRSIMAVHTERPDGYDTHVYPPTATAHATAKDLS